jgi:hypothetical protein
MRMGMIPAARPKRNRGLRNDKFIKTRVSIFESIQRFGNHLYKSLPTSLFQREEMSVPPFVKGDSGGFKIFLLKVGTISQRATDIRILD